ncbi:MAG: nitrous oxide reductase accessory protein NosL [Planctomycetota bacterium]|jgi:copper chaperone NosL
MRQWRRPTVFLAACLCVAAAGCEDAPTIAPPDILLGQDVCDVCGMIISDDRFAAGLVVARDLGYETRAFDDVGCLLAYEAEHTDESVVARYVRDFRSRAWRDAETAVYLHSGQLHTPMAFGLAAVATKADAYALAGEYPGDVIGLPAVRDRFAGGELTIFPKQDPDA